MPDDVFASIWEMFNFIVWSDHIGQSRQHGDETVEYSPHSESEYSDRTSPSQNILLWPLAYPRISKASTHFNVDLEGRSKCLYIGRLIEPLPLAYIWTARTALHVVGVLAYKYQPAFRSLLDLSTIDRYMCAIYLSCTWKNVRHQQIWKSYDFAKCLLRNNLVLA